MKVSVVFDPEDGTGHISKVSFMYDPHSQTPDGLWYEYVKIMREIVRTWMWRRGGKVPNTDKEGTIAWRMKAREWEAPIAEMIAATIAPHKSLASQEAVESSSNPSTSLAPKSDPTVDGSASTP